MPPVLTGWGVYDAVWLSFSSTPSLAAFSDDLINSFEFGDNRKK